jgi:hypothetical protein
MKTYNCLRSVAALAVALVILGSSNRVRAEDAVGDANTAKKPAGKDPTASAFALPKGVTLNAKQQAAYDQLKASKEPELKQAIDDLHNSKSSATGQAAKKVRDLRTQIRNSINDIIYSPSSTSSNTKDAGGNSDGPAYGYAVPYSGYYPYQPYGGYYPYLYRQRMAEGKLPGTKSGNSGGKLPQRPAMSRPAAAPAASGGAKR